MFNILRDAAKAVTAGAGKVAVGAVKVTGSLATEATALAFELANEQEKARKARSIGTQISSVVTKGAEFVVEKAAVPMANMVANGMITTVESTYRVGSGTVKAALAESGSVEQQEAVREAVTGVTDLAIRAVVGLAVGVVVDGVADGIGHTLGVQHVDGHVVHSYVRGDGTPVHGYLRGEHLRHVGLLGRLSDTVVDHVAPTVAGMVAALTLPTTLGPVSDADRTVREAAPEWAKA